MAGVCTMTGGKGWMAEKDIFENNDFTLLEKKDCFELLSKKWDTSSVDPKLINWSSQQSNYNGWHLLYAN